MSRKEEVFIPALKDKKIPVLSLDNNWHRLFTQTEPTDEITSLENELNDLLRLQGKNNTEYKEVRVLKRRLMDEIVELMNDHSKQAEKKIEENKRLIEECNQKIDEFEDAGIELPRQIDEVNYKLMLATMESCYAQIQENNAEIEEISRWVEEMRIELKKKVVSKQQKLKRNQNFYTYMHNIFGPDVINIFDMKYNIEPVAENPDPNLNKEKEND